MQSSLSFSSFVSLLPLLLLIPFTTAQTYLNVTTASAANGNSMIECWQLSTPTKSSAQNGLAGVISLPLGELGNATYSIIPAGFDGGLHNAPAVQYVVILSGSAIVSIPGTTEQALLRSGKNGLTIAADIASVSKVGHATHWLEETVVMQIPIEGNVPPPHTVLHDGACERSEMVH